MLTRAHLALRPAAGLLAFVCVATLSVGIAQESTPSSATPDLTDELSATLRELRQLRSGHYATNAALAAEITTTREVVKTLREEVGQSESEQARLRAEAEAIRADLVELGTRRDGLREQRAAILASIDAFGDAVRPLVDVGLPYRRESRLRAIDGFEAQESPRSAFARLWTFAEDELRVARSGETYSDEIELSDGRVKHARFVRIGKHVLGFVTEDGVDVGIWMANEGWVTDTSRFDPESVRTAVEILDRRRGPEHVSLPIRLVGGDAR